MSSSPPRVQNENRNEKFDQLIKPESCVIKLIYHHVFNFQLSAIRPPINFGVLKKYESIRGRTDESK